MKTILAFTTTMGLQWRYDKTLKFVNYYKDICEKYSWDMIALDNSSPSERVLELTEATNCDILTFQPFYDRPTFLDYLYLWRALFYVKTLHKKYDKVILMDNDFFALSNRIVEYMNNITEGWTTFWSPKYDFPETSCQIIMKNCKEYNDFVQSGDYRQPNLSLYERTVPVTHIAKEFIGDRYGEDATHPDLSTVDFISQATLDNVFTNSLH